MSDDTTSVPDGQAPAPSSSVDTGVAAPQATPETSTATPPPSSGDTPDSKAPSSGDSRQSDREGLLAAVRAVVPSKPETPAVPATPDAGEGEDPAPDQVAASGGQEPPRTDEPLDLNAPDPSEAELKKLRPQTRQRFEILLAQRNEARSQWDTVQPELTQHRQLQGYLTQHQLAPDDVNALLGIGAALRSRNYQQFLDGVTPFVIAAQEALGHRVAKDLQQRVDEGTISEEAARELTQTRHRAQHAETELRAQTQVAQVETTNRNVLQVRHAVEQWEGTTRRRDPDYAHKADAVRRYSQALLQERGIPQTPDQAVALVQAAYDEATQAMLKMRPAPQPTRPAPSGVHVSTNGAAPPEPRTMKEAALQALAAMRAS